jgi:hypothetical protein
MSRKRSRRNTRTGWRRHSWRLYSRNKKLSRGSLKTAFLLQVVRHRHRWHRKPSLNRPPRLRPRDTPPPRRPHPLLNKLRHLRVVRIRQRTSSLRMRWCKRCTSNYFEVSKVCWARSWDTRKFEKKRFPVGRFRKRAGVYGSVQEVGGTGWTALFSLLIVKPF